MVIQSGGNSSQHPGTYPGPWQDGGQVDQQMEGILSVAGYMRQLDSSNLSSHSPMHQQMQPQEEDSSMGRTSETTQFAFMSGLGSFFLSVTSDMGVPPMVSSRDTDHQLGDTSQDRNMSNSYSLMASFGRLEDNSGLPAHQQEHATGSDQLDMGRSGLTGGFGVVPDVASATTQQFLYLGNGMGGPASGYNNNSLHTEDAAEDAGFVNNDTSFSYISRHRMMDDHSGIISAGGPGSMPGEEENDGPRQQDWGNASGSSLAVSANLYQLQEYRRREQLRGVRSPSPPQAVENLGGANVDVPGLAGEAQHRVSVHQLQAEHYAASMRGYNYGRGGIQAGFGDLNSYDFSHAAAAAELLDQSFSASRHMGASGDIPMPETYTSQMTSEDIQDSSYNARASSWNSLLGGSHGGQFSALYNGNSSSFYDSAAQGSYPSVPELSAYASNAVPATSAEALHGYLSHSDTQMQLYLSGYTAGAYGEANGNEAVLGGNPDLRQSGAQHTYFNSALTQSAIAPSNAAVQQQLSGFEGTGAQHLGLATNMQAAPQYPYTWRHQSNELSFFPSNVEAAQESQGLSHYQQSVAEMSEYELFQRQAAAAASLNQQPALHNRGGQGLLSSLGSSEADMGGGSGQSLSLSLFSQNAQPASMSIHAGAHTDVMSLAASAEARLAMQDPGSSANTLSLSHFRPSAGSDLRHSAFNSTGTQQQQVFRAGEVEATPTLPSRFLTFRGKYAKAGRDLLLEICSPAETQPTNARSGAEEEEATAQTDNAATPEAADEAGPSQPAPDLTPDQRSQIEARKGRLITMVGDVDGHYRNYVDHMRVVIVTIDTAMGRCASLPYTKLALHAMSRHFRVLRDAVEKQLKICNRLLGEPNTPTTAAARGELPRLKFLDQQIRQQRAMQHLGMLQQHAWRPQRGLPEKAVILLRAWLFEHFLHPYPKDSDKLTLAKKTGLTRSQVSNWFINARVRLWKPMVEEMYIEESKEEEARQQREAASQAANAEAAGGSSSAQAAEDNDGAEGGSGRPEEDDEDFRRVAKKRRGPLGPIHPPAQAMDGAPAAQTDPGPFGTGYMRFAGPSGSRFTSGTGGGGVSLTLGLRRPDSLIGGRSFQMASLEAALPDAGAPADASQQKHLGPFPG